MIGTLINGGAIISGSLLGYFVGHKLGNSMRKSILQGLGLVTILIGLKMALETRNILLMLGSVLLGVIIGELLRIDQWLEKLGNFLERIFQKRGRAGSVKGLSPVVSFSAQGQWLFSGRFRTASPGIISSSG